VSGAAILAPTLLALGAAFCFALALILTQYGLRTVPSWRSPLYTIGGSMVLAWTAALVFVDWRGFDAGAAAIFAAVGCIFPSWSRSWRCAPTKGWGQRWQAPSAT
jgi:drug/metabolite transporter (DMT)-like permease